MESKRNRQPLSSFTFRFVSRLRVACWLCLFLFVAFEIAGCGARIEDEEACGFIPPKPLAQEGLGIYRSAMACGPGSAQEPAPRKFSSQPDKYASYVGQSTCSGTAKPGVVAFKDLVLKTYPCTGDFGIVRACNSGGKSEHKEGRAWDWKINYPHPAATALLNWLLATDAQGNKHAMARRVGIMYMIWNRKIWSAYKAKDEWRAYNGASPHTDHVHFSFSWDGANKKTSYWKGTVAPIEKVDAKFVGQGHKGAYPASGGAYFSLCPNQNFQIYFTVKNTGNVPWKDINNIKPGSGVRLGFKKGEKLGISSFVSLNQASKKTVNVGESVTFTMNAKAPSKSGSFRTEWQLYNEGGLWFGPLMYLTFNITSKPPGEGKSCQSSGKGECREGRMACYQGKLSCRPLRKPAAEICDGKDNDCDGAIDEEGVCKQEPSPPEKNTKEKPFQEKALPKETMIRDGGSTFESSQDQRYLEKREKNDRGEASIETIQSERMGDGGGILVLDSAAGLWHDKDTLYLRPRGFGCETATPGIMLLPGILLWLLLLGYRRREPL